MSVKPKIGLELTSLHSAHRTRGSGRVAQAYLEGLSECEDLEIQPYTSADFPAVPPEGNGEWKNKLWDRWRLAWEFHRNAPDLIQIIDPIKVPPLSSAPVITMVQDLIPYIYRDRYQTDWFSWYLHWRMKGQIRKSDGIITPSQTTADDLEMMFDISSTRIQPVVHGINHDRFYPRENREIVEVCDKYEVELPYFIMVSDLTSYVPHKSLEAVVEQWTAEPLDEVSLVIVGRRGEYSKRIEEAWPGATRRLVLPGYVNDDELAAFYSGASGLIFPSRYEGFGFPVLEAMACGTRPVVRNVGSVKEIVGPRGIRLEDNSFEERLVEALKPLRGESDRDEESVEHARKFTWQKTISRLQEYYDEFI